MYNFINETAAKAQGYRIKTPMSVAELLSKQIPIDILKNNNSTYCDAYAKDGNIMFSVVKSIINCTHQNPTQKTLQYIIEKQIYFNIWNFLEVEVKEEFSFNIFKEYGINPINFAYNFVIINNKIKQNMPHFSVTIGNPPYASDNQFLDLNIIKESQQMSDIQIIICPAKRLVSDTKLGHIVMENKHLKSCSLYDSTKIFKINPEWKYVGIFIFNNQQEYEYILLKMNEKEYTIRYDDYNNRNILYKTIDFSDELKAIINDKHDLYLSLLNKYKTMVNDGHGFVYEENDLGRGKKYNIVKNDEIGVKNGRRKFYVQQLKTGKYKYCLYKGSFNNSYDEVQEWLNEDPEKLFSGHICWLSNIKCVKNNIKYWLESPIADLWRKYRFKLRSRSNIVSGCAYGEIPALDFEMAENDFRIYVNNLNSFTKKQKEILVANAIHNADKIIPIDA